MAKFLAIFLLLLPLQLSAETLCSEDDEDIQLLIGESEFTLERAESSIIYLREGLPKIIAENHAMLTKRVLSGEKLNESDLFMQNVLHSEHYYLSYPNSVSIVRGTLLKQNAMILKYKYMHSQKKADQEAMERALNEFCEYASSATYVD